MLANQGPADQRPYYGKKHLPEQNLSDTNSIQHRQFIIIFFTVNYGSINIKFYSDSIREVYMCYDKLLFSTYKKINLSFIYISDPIKLNILKKKYCEF